MEKSGSQKALKVISIIMIIFAAITLLGSLLMLVGGGAIGIASVNANDGTALVGGLAMILGAMGLVAGAINLVIGIFGLRGANDPRKIGAFFVLAIIGVVWAAICGVTSIVGGSADATTIANVLLDLVFPVACLVLANNIKKENAGTLYR